MKIEELVASVAHDQWIEDIYLAGVRGRFFVFRSMTAMNVAVVCSSKDDIEILGEEDGANFWIANLDEVSIVGARRMLAQRNLEDLTSGDWITVKGLEETDSDGFLLNPDNYIYDGFHKFLFSEEHIQRCVARFEYLRPVMNFIVSDGDPETYWRPFWVKELKYVMIHIIMERLAKNQKDYLSYGPYWPAVKAVLQPGFLPETLRYQQLEVSQIYSGSNPLETLLMADRFREIQQLRGEKAKRKYALTTDPAVFWNAIDPDMESLVKK